MATIVELSLPATEFPFGRLLTAGTETQIEFERIVPVGTNTIPLFWAWNTDLDEFEQRVGAHEQVLELVAVEQVNDRRLYLLNWDAPEGEFFEGFTAAETIIRSAYGYNSHSWEFEVLFPTQADLTAFHNHCRENDIQYTLGTMQTLTDVGNHLINGALTEKQRNALVSALQRGYFQTPRQVTLSELAAEFDISQQSLSDLIRRGNEALLTHVLLDASE